MTDQKTTDYGPHERGQHGALKPELTGRGHAVRMRVVDACELDRLADRGLITHDEWSAGDHFARKLHAARMMGVPVTNPDRVGGSGEMGSRAANALAEIVDTIRYLDHECNPHVRRVTVSVCLNEGTVKEAEVISLLRAGLATLILRQDRRTLREALNLLR